MQSQADYKKAVEACTESLSLSPRYAKSLLRRAQANEKINTYSALSDALEDYRALRDIEGVNDYTKQESNKAERRLPPMIKERMEKEKEEMLGLYNCCYHWQNNMLKTVFNRQYLFACHHRQTQGPGQFAAR